MSTLTGQRIKDTYDGLLKTQDSTQGIPATGQVIIEDGLGHDSALELGRVNNGATIKGDLNVTEEITSKNLGVTIKATIKEIDAEIIDTEELTTTQGDRNTFIGEGAGNLAGTDPLKIQNTAIGVNALQNTSVGSMNVAIGDASMQSSTTGNSNTAIGSGSLQASTTASFNTAIGRDSLSNNVNGNNNVAIGINALKNNVATSFNVAVGPNCMQNHIQGASNLAFGRDCLQSQNTGTGNIAIGQRALRDNNGVSNNLAIGTDALRNNTTGNQNVAIGRSSQSGGVGTGYGNTTIGFQAGQTLQGSNNVVIGRSATPSNNSISNEITLGNSAISKLRCAVTSITSLSDERDKTDIKPLEYGLDFISQLQPKEFVWNQRVEYGIDYDEDDNEIEVELENANRGKKDFGFIAQEVQELDDDTLRLVSDDDPEKLEMSYGKLVPILVKAIQELQAEVNALKNK